MKGKRCGAKTRAGTPCKRRARWPHGRCRLHGGLSLCGIAHPNFKHGGRSKYWFPPPPSPAALIAAMEAERLSLEEIAARLARRRQAAAGRRGAQAGAGPGEGGG